MQNTLAILSDKRPEGWVLINEEDFDPAVHSEYQLKVANPNLRPSEVLESQEPIETPEALINEPQVRKSGRPRK